MPGIAGFITRNAQPENVALLKDMVGSMLHEPSYSSAVSIDESLGAYAGSVCHTGSYCDCQPIWNESRDIGLIFSGEHYADRDENVRLRASNHVFEEGNASSLVHLYEENGPKFFQLLNGTFSGVILNRRERRVVLFNDRFGLGRIYWHEDATGFYFASEAKALLCARPGLRRIDPRGFGELMVCGCTLQDRTLFQGISLLPVGSQWSFSLGEPVRKVSYFDRSGWEQQTPLAPETYYEELKERFHRILPRYFQGRRPVALSITGGLDSRMIIAGADAAPGKLPCYTFGGMYRDSEDVRIGRLVSGLCQQPHSVITVDERFFPKFIELAKKCVYITDGAMDASAAVGLYVNRQGRDIAPVRMTGNYGSEILRGNVAFKDSLSAISAFSGEMQPFLQQASATYREERQSCNRLSFIAYKQVPWHHYSRYCEEQSQLTVRAPYLDVELVSLAYRAPPGLLLNKQLAYRYTTDVRPELKGAHTDRGLLKRPKFVPAKALELSMELRPRAEYYFDYGMPQWLVKVDRILSPMRLERLFLGQQKYYHYRTWYRNALADQVKEVLLDPKALGRSYLDPSRVRSIVSAHTGGSENHTLEIHKLLSCEFIHSTLID